MNNNCLLDKEEKKNLHKNIFNRGVFKLIPNDVNNIWRNVYLYDKVIILKICIIKIVQIYINGKINL